MDSNFCVFILTHGRPEDVITYDKLKQHGYTGKIYIIIDNEDRAAKQYYKKYGDKVIMFDKDGVSKTFDKADNYKDKRTIVYARNACFKIAKNIGVKYFLQLDDDYYWFGIRNNDGAKSTRNLDNIFKIFIKFLQKTNVHSVAFCQGGDHIGGYDEAKPIKRKAMNSFFCCVDNPFDFIGRINEDVNTYVRLGGLGKIFFTIMNVQLDQKDTQSNNGGMSDVYSSGTYIKSFYPVIFSPSCVKVKRVGTKYKRLHHCIKWANAVPAIIREEFKKRDKNS